MPFKTVTPTISRKENAMYDLERCLKIADAAKERGYRQDLLARQIVLIRHIGITLGYWSFGL